ncbi:glycoside hydrolase family 31 protein [Posidoniimonas corsicana]|uniref:glycoside hydrolase family 31 protein n=1 Tax=Posidoniimonas corsicana TaxID=1938618 RepID=UPI0018D292F0|nr:TIM-barrel domain-containing protein [Posidoniimonas corsicana]
MPTSCRVSFLALLIGSIVVGGVAGAEPLEVDGRPAQLDVRAAGEHAVRITLRPVDAPFQTPFTPALVEAEAEAKPVISVQQVEEPITEQVGALQVEVRPAPPTVVVRDGDRLVQRLTFDDGGRLRFRLDDAPVLGMGEGGPRPPRRAEWRELPVEFDRRGRVHRMRPRWQADAYGSRNPVAMLVGTGGWALFVPTPWGAIDLTDEAEGVFTPIEARDAGAMRQSQRDQQENRGKGVPPMDSITPGAFDLFVFDASDPPAFFQDVATLTGRAALPPRWAMGYMQSHRTLEDDAQLVEIVDTFREKQIPLDAVIYLGTGFTPRGWNTEQPSFDFNPEVFTRDPEQVIADLHDRDVKVVLHMVPWDRDKLPMLTGQIPAADTEALDPGHIAPYWRQHVDLVNAGVDAWWPDEGDWFDLWERMKRHELYYQGPISSQPNRRPWSLHRNGHLGVARWGGWVWSGDTTSSWKTLEAQIAVGLNHSLSLSPFWGSDIGGFYPTPELTGELYARWFQFGAFCPSFRSHGRTWHTRLPWGWGLSELGPLESNTPPLESSLNNHAIEPVAKKYAELRYRLLSYNYTLAWQARSAGLPMMRALWVHYPDDAHARGVGDEYLWGRDLLIAPVYEPDATSRSVYLPAGSWYDWWAGEAVEGGRTVEREVDLATMPIYARAGAIVPVDPLRQFTGQEVDEPTTLRVYSGADGGFTLYEDAGDMSYLAGACGLTRFKWDDAAQRLSATTEAQGGWEGELDKRYRVELMPSGETLELVVQDGAGEASF